MNIAKLSDPEPCAKACSPNAAGSVSRSRGGGDATGPNAASCAQCLARYIPREILRSLWARAAHKCEFVSESGQRCGSQHRLQVDH